MPVQGASDWAMRGVCPCCWPAEHTAQRGAPNTNRLQNQDRCPSGCWSGDEERQNKVHVLTQKDHRQQFHFCRAGYTICAKASTLSERILLVSREENRSTGDARLPPQVPCFKHCVLVTVERSHLYVLIVIRQETVFLPLRLLQPEISFELPGSLWSRAEGTQMAE